MQNANIEFTPRSDNDRIKEGSFVRASELEAKYIHSLEDGKVTLKWQTPQIEIGGIPHPEKNGGKFYRMDYALSITENGEYYKNHMNAQIERHNWHMSGGSFRFRTTSRTLTITATMHHVIGAGPRYSGRGMSGFDVYTGTGTDRVYLGGRMQAFTTTVVKKETRDIEAVEGYNENLKTFVDEALMQETVTLPEGVDGYNEIQINMPLYSGIADILFTLDEDALIAEPLPRDFDAPVVFYGSSITEGACASRPGTAFPNMICRMLNADCRNLGYSSGAHGEDETIAYLASQKMCAFVMDYDHNAVFAQLERSHYKLYKAVRDAHPDIPIVIVSRPVFTVDFDNRSPHYEDEARLELLKNNYKKALDSRDKNVYFVNGYEEFFPIRSMADLYTGDFSHPNDTGMYFMGLAIYKKLAPALEAAKR